MKYTLTMLAATIVFSCSCFSEIYPVPYKVENEVIAPNCYVEIQEVPFSKSTARDQFLLDYFDALGKKDLNLINSFLVPRLQVKKNSSSAKSIMSMPPFEIDKVIKYSFDGYDVYHAGTRQGGTFRFWMCQGDQNARLDIFQTTSIISKALKPFLLTKKEPEEFDCSSLAFVAIGSNDVAKVYFKFRDNEDQITLKLKHAEDNLDKAYQAKDMDALVDMVGEKSLQKISKTFSGTRVLGGGIGSYEPVGVLDMNPLYIYLGYREDKETVVLRKFIKRDDHYLRINYGYSGSGIDVFLGSAEFKIYIGDMIKKRK